MFGLRPALTPLVVAAAGLFAPARAAADAPAEAAAALTLAQQLHDAGRHESCAVEALRAWWLAPDAAPGDKIELASRCLVLGGDPAAALRLLRDRRLAGVVSTSPALRDRSCLLAATLDTRLALPESCQANDLPALRWAEVARALLRARWLAAEQTLATIPADPAHLARAREAAGWVADGQRLPNPSPGLAAALSAAVPGAGRVYIGRWQDGLSSLALVGIPGYFAADGFAQDGTSSVRGWLLGTTAGILYLGNVYGSWIGAEQVHNKAQKALRERIRLGVLTWAAQ